MSNLRYLNQQNPFWDWISQLEATGSNHPFFNAYNPDSRPSRGPPPPNENHAAPPHHDRQAPPAGPHNPEHHSPRPHEYPFGPGFPFGGRHRAPHHHSGPHDHHPRRGSCGARDTAPPFDINKIASFISQFLPPDLNPNTQSSSTPTTATAKDPSTFTPPADIFNTEDAYIIHISLPGAKKEDVGVNWDADKSELSVAGVIYRPGDEEFLKTLALDERQVGVFERKVRLGGKGDDAAKVDAEGVSAKMEEGVLVVRVPKMEGDLVEVRKVDIE